MVDIYGIMYGAKCAVIGFVTNRSISSSTAVKAYIKASGASSYTEVSGVYNSTVYFVQSAWGFDIRELTEGTTYDVYISVSGESSNHLSFTTLAERGSFNYDYMFYNYSKKEEWTDPSESIRTMALESLNTFVNTLEDIGYTNEEITNYYLTSSSGFTYGGLTNGSKQYINVQGNTTVNKQISVMIHEYRHRIFFNETYANSIGYASEKTSYFYNNALLYSLYEVASFFSLNDNKSELYYYHTENNCRDTYNLYGYFLIKILGQQPVDIVFKS